MSFWDVFFLLLIYIPLILVWGFAVLDIFNRDDIGGGAKALWVAVVIFLPFFGTLIYLLLRRPGGTPEEREAIDAASRDFVERYSPTTATEQLKVLADLHDRGKLTDSEFASEKARILAATGNQSEAATV
jgi:Phospholipase_D-nuclease N-terminal/Short C-terminal domain